MDALALPVLITSGFERELLRQAAVADSVTSQCVGQLCAEAHETNAAPWTTGMYYPPVMPKFAKNPLRLAQKSCVHARPAWFRYCLTSDA